MNSMTLRHAAAILLCTVHAVAFGQTHNEDVWKHENLNMENYRQYLHIPDIDGYYTLKCDLHVHTDMTDGQVWPEGRVNEAWNDGLDAIAITDHIEYIKYPEVWNIDRNTSWKIAKKRGDRIGIIVIPGAEVTRKKPLGHINALFLQDANLLAVDDEMKAIEAALAQGAILNWNHPGYPDGKSDIYPVHERLMAEGKLTGVEVFNKRESYPKAFDWIGKYNLAPIAGSDMHYMSRAMYPERGSRPMTLVFAKEKSAEGIREAMMAKRTLALFDGNLMGNADLISQLLDKCIEIKHICYTSAKKSKATFEIVNSSDIRFMVQPEGYDYPVPVYPGHSLRIDIMKGQKVTFANCILGMGDYYSRVFWE